MLSYRSYFSIFHPFRLSVRLNCSNSKFGFEREELKEGNSPGEINYCDKHIFIKTGSN